MPNERTWFSIDNTHILMERSFVGELPEWHPIAKCVLRQVYPTVAPAWFAWVYTGMDAGNDLVGRNYKTDEEARTAVLEKLRGQ